MICNECQIRLRRIATSHCAAAYELGDMAESRHQLGQLLEHALEVINCPEECWDTPQVQLMLCGGLVLELHRLIPPADATWPARKLM